MKIRQYYEEKAEKTGKEIKRLRQKRNRITAGKLVVFSLFCIGLYRFAIGREFILLLYPLVGAVLFVILAVWDNRVVRYIRNQEALLRCCRTEIRYLEGDYSALPEGEEYREQGHAYAEDLDILGTDSLFQHLNRTVTPEGRELLAHWLLNLCRTREEILARQEAVADMINDPDALLEFRAVGEVARITSRQLEEIDRWLKEPRFFRKPLARGFVYVFNGITLTSWILAFFSVWPFAVALFFSLFQLGYMAFFLRKINLYYKHLGEIVSISGGFVALIKWMEKQHFVSERMKHLQERLLPETGSSLVAFTSLRKILSGFDQRNNILMGFVTNALYMSDFHFLIRLDSWKEVYGERIRAWREALSETDALVSMVFYRFNHPDYVVPVPAEAEWIEAREMGHPMLPPGKSVCNDFTVDQVHRFFIVTGANMAGKSTFLRTVGVNLVLALSGNVVCSKEFRFRLMGLFTSMRTTDNLAKGTSYFHAELLRLKQLIAEAEQSERLFIILDEMLKGTNSVDKLNGSLRFLERLPAYPVSGIIATHDLELGELARRFPEYFFNYCFEITHTNGDIVYDYKLKPGISRHMNASLLLKQMGLI